MQFLKDHSWVNRLVFPAPASSYDVDTYPNELIWIPKRTARNNTPHDAHYHGSSSMRWTSSKRQHDDTQPSAWSPSSARTPPTPAPAPRRRASDVIPCLWLPHRGASGVVIFTHGNATDVGMIRDTMRCIGRALGLHFLLMEYRGYGVNCGSPTESNVLDDARDVLSYLVEEMTIPARNIIVFGRSIGTGPAVDVASRTPGIGGLVTMSAYTSVCGVVKNMMGAVASSLIADRFTNAKKVAKVECPCVFVHGNDDELIPAEHSQLLYDRCGSDQKELVRLNYMDHNNCFDATFMNRHIIPAIRTACERVWDGPELRVDFPQSVWNLPDLSHLGPAA